MALYNQIDIGATFSGDVCLDGRGDVLISTSLETYKAAANFTLRTDRGDYAPNVLVGANLGTFVGANNTEDTHSEMEYQMDKALSRIFSSEDYSAVTTAFDIDEALCSVFLAGTYLVDNEYQDFDQIRMIYSFPYIEGEATPLVIS